MWRQVRIFVFDLVGFHEDVGVILVKTADAEHPVDGAGGFISVNVSHFGDAKWKFAVTVRVTFVVEHAAGAVHGLDGKLAVFYFGCIHVFAVVFPVA